MNRRVKIISIGLLMGAADIIPGVSGGTIAFITGIYEKLIKSIKSFNLEFVKRIFKFKFKEALMLVNFEFLLPLGSGIAISIVGLSRVMNYLMNNQAVFTWSFFFGLILASILIIFKKIEFKKISGVSGLIIGIFVGYFLTSLIPVKTPDSWWFIVLSGMIAISAMILPGLSGSFILLILGKYEFMTAALKNPFIYENLIVIIFFIFGCTMGVIIFSRVLNYFFKNYHNFTLAILTGLITGSLGKIWPWKEGIEFSWEFYFSLFLIVFGFLLVLGINFLGKKENKN